MDNLLPPLDVPPIQNFFFLIFYSNPQTGRVYIYADGDEHRIMLNHEYFIQLIIDLTGYKCLPAIHEALSTYGSFWIFDRENNNVQRLALRGSDDLINIQDQIQKALKRETTPEQNPMNPAEQLAYTPVTTTLPTGKNPFQRNTEDSPMPIGPTVTIKKR